MMKFASFETIVEMIYNSLPGQKSDYNKGAQTAVAFTGGYLAGILCAVVSHPADVMVSKLNANRQAGEAFGAAMSRIYKDIGFGGLWNGLPVRIVMIGTLVSASVSVSQIMTDLLSPLDRTAVDDVCVTSDLQYAPLDRQRLTFCSYDSFKIFMGLPTTGGGPPAEKK